MKRIGILTAGGDTPALNVLNYVTPGYATAVFVSAYGVERIRTTAESHRRIRYVKPDLAVEPVMA